MRNRQLERVVVVGAGIIGLAVARALAHMNREVLILESEAGFGTSASARSSEVIHAGIYYRPGCLKARTCIRGRELLYEYAQDRGVAVRRLGKLIVASTPDELPMLEKIRLQAQTNGVTDVQLLSAAAVRALEPALDVLGALVSPSTGIVDSRALMLALLGDAEAGGAQVVYGAKVCGARAGRAGFQLRVENGAPSALECAVLVNCAGLGSVELARNIVGLEPRFVPRAYLCKGSYFGLRQSAPFRHLIYPLPDAQGLGVHLTFDLAGAARFGPDTEWVETADYRVDPDRAAEFERAVRRYWPGLPHGSLHPMYAGLRAKIVGPGEAAADFRIDGPAHHGVPGLINLFGIESPGLTAALGIAEVVAALVAEG